MTEQKEKRQQGKPKSGENRRKQKRKKNPAVWIGILIIGLILVLIYVGGFWYYQTRFLPGTSLGSLELSGKKPEEVPGLLKDYELTIVERSLDGGQTELSVSGSAVGLQVETAEKLEEILSSQNAFAWLFARGRAYEPRQLLTLDESLLTEVVEGLPGRGNETSQLPQDAYIERRADGNGYEIIPETQGNRLRQTETMEAVREAVLCMQETLNLEEADCYEHPSVLRDDEELQGQLQLMNHLSEIEIVYTFGDQQEILDGSQISQWLSLEDNQVVLDKDQVADYVASLRKKYDTIFRSRTFTTSYGKTITLSSGDYGWWMNYKQETEELYEMILRGESGTRTPVYYQTAAAYGAQDYGNTYIEINLTAQHLFYYENGSRVLESDIVSGNPNRGNATPAGAYGITYKQRDAVLVGETYETPVSYWMPFNGNIGLHDASWQSSFGGNRYLTNGSHGCINLPPSFARQLYERVEKGTPVICYELPGTEPVTARSGAESTAGQNSTTSQSAVIGQETEEEREEEEQETGTISLQ